MPREAPVTITVRPASEKGSVTVSEV
jgi:hypothetical protein